MSATATRSAAPAHRPLTMSSATMAKTREELIAWAKYKVLCAEADFIAAQREVTSAEIDLRIARGNLAALEARA